MVRMCALLALCVGDCLQNVRVVHTCFVLLYQQRCAGVHNAVYSTLSLNVSLVYYGCRVTSEARLHLFSRVRSILCSIRLLLYMNAVIFLLAYMYGTYVCNTCAVYKFEC